MAATTPPINPFFTIPDLASDGDFEAIGIGENAVVPQPPRSALKLPPRGLSVTGDSDYPANNWYNDSFTAADGPGDPHDSDHGFGGDHQGTTSDGSDRSGDSDQGRGGDHQGTTGDGSDRSGDGDHGGGGDHHGFLYDGGDSSGNDTDTGVGNDHSYYDYGDVSDADHGGGKDQRGSNRDGWDNSGDFDQGAGRDHQGTNSDGSDRSGDGDYGTPTHTDYTRGSDGGDMQQATDSDNGHGGDHKGKNWDAGDNSGDGDVSPWGSGLDRGGIAWDGGDTTIDSDNGAGGDITRHDGYDVTVISYVDGDQSSPAALDALWNDGGDQGKADFDYTIEGNFDPWPGDGKDNPSKRQQSDPCQAGCDELSMVRYIPSSGLAALAGLELARAIIAASIDIAMLPFGGEAEAESLVYQALDTLGTLLKKAGLPDPLATIIESVLNAIGVPSGPLDILGFAARAASLLDPSIYQVKRQNSIDAFNALIKAHGGCICEKCLQAYKKYGDGTPVKVCRNSAH